MTALFRMIRSAALALAVATAVTPAAGYAQPAADGEVSTVAAWIASKMEERERALRIDAPASGGVILQAGATEAEAVWAETALDELRERFDPDSLDVDDLIRFRRFEEMAESRIAAWRWRDYSYVFSAAGGPHLMAPTMLSQAPAQTSAPSPGAPPLPEAISATDIMLSQAKASVRMLEEATAEFERRAALGLLPPRRMFPEMIEDARAVITGAPFEGGAPSAVLSAVSRNLDAQNIDDREKSEQLAAIAAILATEWKPAYRNLIAALERWAPTAPEREGVTAMPGGADYYDYLVATSTDGALTAAEARAIGERELTRIHAEIEAAMAEVDFTGTLPEFFDWLRTADRFYYPNTEEGRAEYLAEARRVIDAMQARLDEVVADPPSAPLDVIRFPPEDEGTAPSGMYINRRMAFSGAAIESAENNAYVVNLADMRAAPKYMLQALAHHEGLPGHHLQMQMGASGGLFGTSTLAYAEGWAFYAERLPYEMGLYEDPYSNIGRLGMEAWRAARLVVDTGIHAEGWTQDQAVQFMLANTPLTETQARIEALRYANAPGQATGYMTGMLKILELRERARAELGDDFDIREFHAQVLGHGALSLALLEEVIDRWIAERLAARSSP